MDNVTGFVEALQGGAAYLAVGYGTALFLAVWRFWQPRLFEVVDGKPAIIPARWQWIPAYLVAGLTAFGLAFQAGEPVGVAATMALLAAATGGGVAVGGHRSLKELAGRTSKQAKKTVALLACLAMGAGMATTGCAGAVLANNPALSAVVDKAMAWIGLIDSVVSTLLKDPNVPPDWASKYDALRVKFAQAAVVVADLANTGEEANQQTIAATEELQKIGEEIVALLQSLRPSTRTLEDVTIPEPRFK